MKNTFLFLAISFASSLQLFSQEKPDMITDRPDQTESASVMSIKSIQIETGFVFEKVNEYQNNISYNTSLFRYGLFKKLELRMGLEYLGVHISQDGGDYNTEGFGPIAIGAKYFLRDQDEKLPQLALLTTFSLPGTGNNNFDHDNLGVDVRIAGEYSVNEAMSLGANVGVAWSGIKGEDYATGIYTAVIGLDLTENLGAFAELYGFLPGEGKNDHRWDGGVTYAVNENVQLDLSTGLGLSKVSPDFFISFGLSVRIP